MGTYRPRHVHLFDLKLLLQQSRGIVWFSHARLPQAQVFYCCDWCHVTLCDTGDSRPAATASKHRHVAGLVIC